MSLFVCPQVDLFLRLVRTTLAQEFPRVLLLRIEGVVLFIVESHLEFVRCLECAISYSALVHRVLEMGEPMPLENSLGFHSKATDVTLDFPDLQMLQFYVLLQDALDSAFVVALVTSEPVFGKVTGAVMTHRRLV